MKHTLFIAALLFAPLSAQAQQTADDCDFYKGAYAVVVANNAQDLQAYVQDRMQCGWRPVGGVAFKPSPVSRFPDQIMQAMVKDG